jgi:signal transduction histidine kinase
MQGITDNISLLVVIVMMGIFILVASFIFLLLRNQNKLVAEKNKRQAIEIEHQKQLLRSVIESQEAERTRIGRDLHDSVGAALYSLRISMDRFVKDNHLFPSVQEWTGTGKSLVDNIIGRVRDISHNLSPEILTMQTLTEAIEELCYTIDNNSGLSVYFTNEAGAVADSLDLTSSLALYRVLEELITNTVKHAGAGNIHVYLGMEENTLIIDYRDDGKGMPVTTEVNKGRGLQNIESRLQIVKGAYTTSSTSGYHIRIRIPMPINQP